MLRTTPDQIIGYYVNRLREAGAHNVGEYETRLRQNAGNLPNLNNFLSEAVAALMLLDYGADVTMQDRPDLAAVVKGERLYAEVKHFNRKMQDDLNDEAVRNAPEFEFVLLEDTTRTEGKPTYRQIADVAIKKADQYREGEINILIIDSDSETLHLMARSGAQGLSLASTERNHAHHIADWRSRWALERRFRPNQMSRPPHELSTSSRARGNEDGNGPGKVMRLHASNTLRHRPPALRSLVLCPANN
jgi:hypothetical protein